MKKTQDPNFQRKLMGITMLAISIIILCADILWLYTGDIHKTQLHFTMRGGWFGFWVTAVVSVFFIAAGLYLIFTREPLTAIQNKQELSLEEKNDLKKWHTKLIVSFAIFWLIFFAGILLKNKFVFLGSVLLGFYGIMLQFSKRCPNCGFRIVYHGQLVLPQKCVRCSITFK